MSNRIPAVIIGARAFVRVEPPQRLVGDAYAALQVAVDKAASCGRLHRRQTVTIIREPIGEVLLLLCRRRPEAARIAAAADRNLCEQAGIVEVGAALGVAREDMIVGGFCGQRERSPVRQVIPARCEVAR